MATHVGKYFVHVRGCIRLCAQGSSCAHKEKKMARGTRLVVCTVVTLCLEWLHTQ
jgi:hypothetical protein